MNIVICVPIYKKALDQFEMISLTQLSRVLGKYEIVFVAPPELEFDFSDVVPNYSVERFDSSYFNSREGYSHMLLTCEYYKRFIKYEWMLVYQLDAFVFEDRLEEFTDKGYDYIGAPVITGLFDVIGTYVGNGGLSLRNIRNTYSLLYRFGREILDDDGIKMFGDAEDVFFSYCGLLNKTGFKVADIETASEFSLEFNTNHRIDKMREGALPFGTHLWYGYDYYIWKEIIEQNFSFKLPDCKDVKYFDMYELGTRWWDEYTLLTTIRETNSSIIRGLIQEFNLGFLYKCRIWGAGCFGRRCLRLFKALRIDVDYIYDKNIKALDYSIDIRVPVIKPDKTRLLGEKDRIILIAMDKPGEEVFDLLTDAGFLERKNYILYKSFIFSIEGLLRKFRM